MKTDAMRPATACRRLLLAVVLALIPTILPATMMAQPKKFTLEDLFAAGKNYSNMAPKSIVADWWGNTLVSYKNRSCVALDGKGGERVLFTLDKLHAAMKRTGIDTKLCASCRPQHFGVDGMPVAVYYSSKLLMRYNWETDLIEGWTLFERPALWPNYHEASGNFAYQQDYNVWVVRYDVAKGYLEPEQVSRDGSLDVPYGESVHRNEFGIDEGSYWSPDGQSLCYYREDQSMVPVFPLVDIEHRIAKMAPTKYPMAGELSHKVSMGVYSLATKQTVWLQTGDNTDRYYSGITWTPDCRSLVLYNMNRAQDKATLQQYSALTGRHERDLMTISDDRYLDMRHGGVTFVPWDADRLLYWSKHEDLDGLYLYSIKEGKTLRRVTPLGIGVVKGVLGFCRKSRSVIVSSTGTGLIRTNIYAVTLDKCRERLLGDSRGVHSAKASANGEWVFDRWSAPDMVCRNDLVNTCNGRLTTLSEASDPWQGYAAPQIVGGSLTAADGQTPLFYRMVRPAGFDSTKRYPAIVYVYGGPGLQNVDESWHYRSRPWEAYMAQHGYIIFVIDNRGSAHRGRAFETCTFRHLGREEMRDQMVGVDYLRSLPYVDADRLGVHGWSYGGFMTMNLMLTHPDVFKVGVAGGPVTDWSLYEVMYGERYMGRPQDNPEGYRENNLPLRAGNLKGRLLIIYGGNDGTCVPQHTLSFIHACQKAGTYPDLMTYPMDEHNMRGRNSIHLHEYITRYFLDHLK